MGWSTYPVLDINFGFTGKQYGSLEYYNAEVPLPEKGYYYTEPVLLLGNRIPEGKYDLMHTRPQNHRVYKCRELRSAGG